MVNIIMDSESEAYTSFVKDDFCDNLEKVAQSFLPDGLNDLHVSSDNDDSGSDIYPLEDGELEEGELEECEIQCDENEKENEENVKAINCDEQRVDAVVTVDEKVSDGDKPVSKPDRPINALRTGKRKRHTKLKPGKSKRLNERTNWKVPDEKQPDDDEEMYGVTWPPRMEDLMRSSEDGDEDEVDETEECGENDERTKPDRKKNLSLSDSVTNAVPEFGGFVERRTERTRTQQQSSKNEKRKPSKRRAEKSRKFLELRRLRESARERNNFVRDKTAGNRREPPVCKFYMEARCNKGGDCPFSHDFQPAKKPELCKYYLNGYCAKNEVCNFMHSEFPCKFFHTGSKECLHGPRCRFSHEPIGEDIKNAFEKHLRDLDEQPKRPSLLGSPPRSLKEQNEKLAECRKTSTPLSQAGGQPQQSQQQTATSIAQQIPSLMDIHLDTNNQNKTPQAPCSQPFYQDSLFNYDEQQQQQQQSKSQSQQQQQQQQQQHLPQAQKHHNTEGGFGSNNQQRATPPHQQQQHAQTSSSMTVPPPPHPGMMPIPPPNLMMHSNMPPIHRPPPNILSPVGPPPPRWNEHHPPRTPPFFYTNVPPTVMSMPNVGQVNANIMHFAPLGPPPNIAAAIRNELDERVRPDLIGMPHHQPRLPPPPVSLALPNEWRMPIVPLPSQGIQPQQQQQQQQQHTQNSVPCNNAVVQSGDGSSTGKRTLQDLINAISRNYSSPPRDRENDTNENRSFSQGGGGGGGQFVEFMKVFDKIQTDSQNAYEESVKSTNDSAMGGGGGCVEVDGNSAGNFAYHLIPITFQNKSYQLPEPADPLDPRIPVYKKKMENFQVGEEDERQPRVELLKTYSSSVMNNSTGNHQMAKKSADPRRIKDPRLKTQSQQQQQQCNAAEEMGNSCKPSDPRRSRQLAETTKLAISSEMASTTRTNVSLSDQLLSSSSLPPVSIDDDISTTTTTPLNNTSSSCSSPTAAPTSHLKISFADYFQRKNRTTCSNVSSSSSSDTFQNNESNANKML